MHCQQVVFVNLVPRPLFCFLRFAFSIITWEQNISKKWGRPGLIYHANDVRWTQGGRREEGLMIKCVWLKLKSEFLTREDRSMNSFNHTKV